MKGILNEYSHTFHNSYTGFRKVFSKKGLVVLNNDIRKAPLQHLRLVLFTKSLMDWEDT